MNKLFVIFALFLVFPACRENIIPKPKNLIAQSQMENIMYDLTILDAIKNTDYAYIERQKANLTQLLYQKYAIDSLQLAESMVYYASRPKVYNRMMSQVEQRLKAERKSLLPAKDSLSEKNLQQEATPEKEKVELIEYNHCNFGGYRDTN